MSLTRRGEDIGGDFGRDLKGCLRTSYENVKESGLWMVLQVCAQNL